MKTMCTRSSYACVRVCRFTSSIARSRRFSLVCTHVCGTVYCSVLVLASVCVFVYGVAVVYKKIDLLVSFGSNCAFKQLYSVGMQRQRQR